VTTSILTDILVLLLVVFVVIPSAVYVTVKLATVAYLRGRQFFEREKEIDDAKRARRP
jgi:hypothetical protein